MAKVLKTPGVYIQEVNAFPNAVVPVPTAVPAFIGYTEKAERGGHSLHLTPTKIASLRDYEEFFGGAARTKVSIRSGGTAGQAYRLNITESHFTLHAHLRMFFQNGGGKCYIVSVGGYTDAAGEPSTVTTEGLRGGLAPLEREEEPTLVVIPELTNLTDVYDAADEPDTAAVQERLRLTNDVLNHCHTTQSRFAILDVWIDRRNYTATDYDHDRDVHLFREGIGPTGRAYGAAYYPYLDTNIISPDEVSFLNVANPDVLLDLLDRALSESVVNGTTKAALADEIKKLFRQIPTADLAEAAKIHKALSATLPLYKQVTNDILRALNLLPPSGAMAGIYAATDNQRGVWQSPANVGVVSASGPAVVIDDRRQEGLNVPLDGLAINAIRSFPGRGTLVWGARTLDGNSGDWRYIAVRRTVIFVEQSAKLACKAYVFEPNNANTWTTIKAMLTNFLTGVWQQGGLAGATPQDAFSVRVGLGETMTPEDILNGNMVVSLMVAVSRPAEFIVITFQQDMART